jgi:mannosyl-oligosaccharide glucosidase
MARKTSILLWLFYLIGFSVSNHVFDKAGNDSLLWGTYRPNLYFGTRPRIPESLMSGLLWFNGKDFQGFQSKKKNVTLFSTL